MNQELLEKIVSHILEGFGVVPSSFIDLRKSKSLMDPSFMLDIKLSFESPDGGIIKNKVWGCQLSFLNQDIKIMLGDCSIQSDDTYEYAMVVQPTVKIGKEKTTHNLPAYGLYLVYTHSSEMYKEAPSACDKEALLACSVDNKEWMECSTFLQGTFLAAMEQLKEANLAWSKCTDYTQLFHQLSSLIKYHMATYEAKDER